MVATNDIAYNERTNFAALVSVHDKIAYHLFDLTELKIIKKARWPDRVQGTDSYSRQANVILLDAVTSLSIDPEGTRIALIDSEGTLLISELGTADYITFLELEDIGRN